MESLKKTAVAAAITSVVVFAMSNAHAGKDAAQVISYLGSSFYSMMQKFINSKIDAQTASINGTFREVMAQSTGTLSGELTKSTLATKSVLEGLEGLRQEEQLRRDAVELQAKMEMPASTCQDMAVQDGLAKASAASQAAVITGQRATAAAVKSNNNTLNFVENLREKANTNYCSKEDGARGLCKYDASNVLSGADQEALYLFQAPSGSRTYEASAGSGKPSQYDAAGDYIQRMVVGIPPEQLRTKDLDKTPQGKAYIELMRRYNGMISMSSYSLNQIREAGRPIKGLGEDTQLAKVDGFAEEVDMSMGEAVRRFVKEQFNPKVVQDLANASEPNKILRAMAKQNSFGLWMDYQNMEQNSRMEAMLAAQLALFAEQSLRPQIDAQRVAAARAAK